MTVVLTITISDPFGGLGQLVSGNKAGTSLERLALGIRQLNAAQGAATERSPRISLHGHDLKRTANQISTRAPMTLARGVSPEQLLAQVELASSPEAIATKTTGATRAALIVINNSLSGSSLIADVTLGDAAVRLDHFARAAPVQKGISWRGEVVGVLECQYFRKRLVELSPLEIDEGPCQSVMVSTERHQGFFNALSQENAVRLIHVAGEGTLNGATLWIPLPDKVGFAADATAARMPLAPR